MAVEPKPNDMAVNPTTAAAEAIAVLRITELI
jgi:hypothetical protein